MILIFVGYCILVVPAKSAADDEHHLHKNPTIFGSKSLSFPGILLPLGREHSVINIIVAG
jgi:hypothetical protein